MKVPMQWIKKYADIPVDAATYQNQMIMIGNGVEGYEDLGAEVENVVVGRVLTCEPHPDSDHLHVTTVDVGGDAPLQIVCGAPNCRAFAEDVVRGQAQLYDCVVSMRKTIRDYASQMHLTPQNEAADTEVNDS